MRRSPQAVRGVALRVLSLCLLASVLLIPGRASAVDPQTLDVPPTADTWTGGALSSASAGADTVLHAGGEGPRRAFLRFDVDVPDGRSITGAVLHLTPTDSGPAGASLATFDGSQLVETSTIRSNEPTVGAEVTVLPAATPDVAMQIDVAATVTAEGVVGLAISSSASDDVSFASRESAPGAPFLRITHEAPDVPSGGGGGGGGFGGGFGGGGFGGGAAPTEEPTEEPTQEPTEEVAEEPTEEPAPQATTIGSDDSAATALLTSQSRFADAGGPLAFAQSEPTARTATWAVVAREDQFPDALAGSALTGTAPLLYTAPDGLSPDVADEIDRVLGDAGTVYLLGGEAALSSAVADAVSAAGHTPVRLEGPTRIETALAVADEVRRLYGPGSAALARSRGTDDNPTAAWADSVTAGGWAASTGSPVLLTPSGALHPLVEEWLRADAPQALHLLGGPLALAEGITLGFDGVTRVSGTDRAATATAIAEQLWGQPASGPRSHVVINGYAENGWAFGLVAAGLAADDDAPILLADVERIPPATEAAATSCADEPVALTRVGGPAQIADGTLAALDALDDEACPAFATFRLSAVATSTAIEPTADTWTGGGRPTLPKGDDTQLSVDGREDRRGYLRFDVAIPEDHRIKSASLSLHALDTAPAGVVTLHSVADSTWAETIVTAAAPVVGGVLATVGATSPGQDVQLDVSSAVTSEGPVAFGLTSTGVDDATFASHESGTPPTLTVTTEEVAAVQEVSASSVGSSDPTAFPSNRRLDVSAGGRRLAVHGKHGDGVVLRWRDEGQDTWKDLTQGRSTVGGLLTNAETGTVTGDWSASITVGADANGDEHAWVIMARDEFGTGDATTRPLHLVRLTDLDSADGPVVGPLQELSFPDERAKRPDIVYAVIDGTPQVSVVTSLSGSAGVRVAVGFLDDLTADTPTVPSVQDVVPTPAASTRFGSFVPTGTDLRMVLRGPSSDTFVWKYVTTGTPTWVEVADTDTELDSSSGSASPNGVGFDDGSVLVANQPAGSGGDVLFQRIQADGTLDTRLGPLTGYSDPILTGDGTTAVLVMIRDSDGAVVSRTYTVAGGLSGADVVQIAASETGGAASAPSVPRTIDGRLLVLVRGAQFAAGNPDQFAVVASSRAL